MLSGNLFALGADFQLTTQVQVEILRLHVMVGMRSWRTEGVTLRNGIELTR